MRGNKKQARKPNGSRKGQVTARKSVRSRKKLALGCAPRPVSGQLWFDFSTATDASDKE
jgi:hypothetical protein